MKKLAYVLFVRKNDKEYLQEETNLRAFAPKVLGYGSALRALARLGTMEFLNKKKELASVKTLAEYEALKEEAYESLEDVSKFAELSGH